MIDIAEIVLYGKCRNCCFVLHKECWLLRKTRLNMYLMKLCCCRSWKYFPYYRSFFSQSVISGSILCDAQPLLVTVITKKGSICWYSFIFSEILNRTSVLLLSSVTICQTWFGTKRTQSGNWSIRALKRFSLSSFWGKRIMYVFMVISLLI